WKRCGGRSRARVVCRSVDAALAAAAHGGSVRLGKDAASVPEAAPMRYAQAQVFLSDVNGPPESEDEQPRLSSRLHARDYVSRVAESAGGHFRTVKGGA